MRIFLIIFFFCWFFRTLIPNDEELLTAVTVDTFGNMCLSHVTLSDLKSKIIHYMKEGATIAVSFY